MKKTKYAKPIITRIKLDPEQAVLVACSNAAGDRIYFAGLGCVVDGGMSDCTISVRAQRGTRRGSGVASDQPT